ncbi:MAG: hypothetical protein U1E28_18680 [Beijerinckiaceae bacterium]
MGNVTYFVVLPLVRNEDGDLVAEEGQEAPTAAAAQLRAQAMVGKKAGAIAFSRSGDPAVGEFEDAIVLGRYGDAPDDPSSLMEAS